MPPARSARCEHAALRHLSVTRAGRSRSNSAAQRLHPPGSTITATVGSIDPVTNDSSPAGNTAVQVVAQSFLKHAFVSSSSALTTRAVARVKYLDGGCPPGDPGGGGGSGAIAGFSVGSTLASLDTSKSRLDPMLRTMFGASGSFSAVSYNGLANANLSLGRLQTALLAAGSQRRHRRPPAQHRHQGLATAQATATALTAWQQPSGR